MKEQKTIKTALMVAAAGILTLVVIVLCYYLINEPDEASHIALPDYSVIPSDQPDLPDESDLLADVTPENVQRVLESITPLEAYHQELTQEYFWADGSAVRTAESPSFRRHWRASWREDSSSLSFPSNLSVGVSPLVVSSALVSFALAVSLALVS